MQPPGEENLIFIWVDLHGMQGYQLLYALHLFPPDHGSVKIVTTGMCISVLLIRTKSYGEIPVCLFFFHS